MAVRPLYVNDAGDPGESDDDPGMMVDEVIEEMDSPGDAGASGGQPPEAQVAPREESEVELEQSGFFGSRKPKITRRALCADRGGARGAREDPSSLEVLVPLMRRWRRGFSASSPRSGRSNQR